MRRDQSTAKLCKKTKRGGRSYKKKTSRVIRRNPDGGMGGRTLKDSLGESSITGEAGGGGLIPDKELWGLGKKSW